MIDLIIYWYVLCFVRRLYFIHKNDLNSQCKCVNYVRVTYSLLSVLLLDEFKTGQCIVGSNALYSIASVGYDTSKLYRDTDTDTWFRIVSRN